MTTRSLFARWRQTGGLTPRRSRRVGLEALPDRVAPATHVWSGAVNNLWSVAGHWSNGAPTEVGAALVFPAAAANKANNTNDLAGAGILSMTFEGGGYAVRGNRINLGSTGVTSQAGVSSGRACCSTEAK